MTQRKSTDETGRFMKAIAAFSALPEVTTAHGRLLQMETTEPAQAILVEISETVLHRYLTISRNDGERIILDVSERRVLTVIEVPHSFAENHGSLAGRQLDDQDAANLWAFFSDFAKGAKALFVQSLLPKSGSSVFGGVPVGRLFDLAANAQDQSMPSHLAQVFAGSVGQSISFVAYRSEECLIEEGAPQDRDILKTYLKGWPSRSETERKVTLWAVSADLTRSTLLVTEKDIKVALICPFENASSMFVEWHQAIFSSS